MPDTVPDATTSTAVIPIGASVYGTIDSNGDHDWYRVELVAGQTYQFRLHGVGTGQLSDPILTLRDGTGKVLASNDDAGAAIWGNSNAVDPLIQFTASSSGTYFLDVGAFENSGTGDFLLTAVVNDPAGMVFTTDEIAWQLTNNFTEASVGGGNVRPFAWNVGGDGSLTVNISALTAEGQFLARNALRAWTDVTGIAFVETSGTAEITFDDNESGLNAYATWSATGGFITAATVQITTAWLAQFGTGFQSYSFETYIHEIGHALGLGHAGNYNGSATYGVDNYYVNDSLAYSVMSYMQASGDEFGGPNTFVPADFRFMLTPAIADIIAVHNLYGDSTSTRAGNTTYGFNSTAGNAALDAAVTIGADMFMTVYDDGGIDTLDFSATGAAEILCLAEESFSSVLGGSMNLSIARGVTIENAFAGSGNDTLIGNAVANRLRGGAGDDTIRGGEGADTAIFAGLRSAYTVTALAGNSFQVTGPDGTDTLIDVEWLSFDDQTISWPLDPDDFADSLADTGHLGQVPAYGLAGGNLETAGDHDWFGVQLTAGVRYSINLLGSETQDGTLHDPYLRLYDAAGVLVTSDDDGGLNVNSRIVYTPGASGTFFLEAAAFSEIYTGTYTVSVAPLRTMAALQSGAGQLGVWSIDGQQLDPAGSGAVTLNGSPVSLGPDWHALRKGGFADFGGDGLSDLLWRNENGNVAIWQMVGTRIDPAGSGTVTLNGAAVSVGPEWQFEGAADFKGDGATDVFWRNSAGQVALWDMNGRAIDGAGTGSLTFNGSAVALGQDWTCLATGDFGNDGSADILWRHMDGRMVIWDLNGLAIDETGSGFLTFNGDPVSLGSDWQVLTAADFTGDGSADLLWRDTSGALAIWEMNGTQINPAASGAVTYNGSPVSLGPEWRLGTAGDMTGDGKADLLWDNGSTAGVWVMDGRAIDPAGTGALTFTGSVASHPSDWHFV